MAKAVPEAPPRFEDEEDDRLGEGMREGIKSVCC